jgi:aminopeptidase
MRSDRLEALARIVVRYSTRVRPGDLCTIEAPAFCSPFVLAIAREILRAGGHPVVRLELDGSGDAFIREASDATLDWLAPGDVVTAERADVRIIVDAEWNTRSQTTVDPERLARRSRARTPLRTLFFERGASGDLRWLVVGYPCEAAAQDAGMSLHDYEELLAATCLLDDPDPVARWEAFAGELDRVAAFLAGVDELRFVAPGGTDLRLRVGGRRWYPSAGREYFPDGEVFTGPVEDSAEGTVAYSFPAVYRGREVDGVRLRFERGRVVEATAERGEEFLLAMLDQDDGARFLGEVAFGLNDSLTEFTRSTLLDEKIGGTFHLAVGASYPETGGVNVSALHWDMVCDLRSGGEVWADGRLVYRDGRFLDGVLPG